MKTNSMTPYRPINKDSVEVMLANTNNHVMIALAESWLGLLKRLEEQDAELDEKERALTDWENKCGQLEDELFDLQEERSGRGWHMPYGREHEVGAW